MRTLYPRHYLDISTADLLRSAAGKLKGRKSGVEIRALESDLGGDALVALSVRSAWDLLLSAFDFPEGSEVIMSAVTIPHMARIVEAHGLVVVPVDLDPATMMPRVDIYSRAFTERTRLVILAHLLGGSFDISPYAIIAELHGVALVEDRAQAFTGPGEWGSPRAIASFFSFGSIKTCTALGGAVAIVRDTSLLAAMREMQSEWPAQDCTQFSRKARKYLGVQGFRSPVVYGAVAGVAGRGKDGLDGFIHRTVKGFPASSPEALLSQLRQRPSGAQVAMLRRRLDTWDDGRLTARAERGELLQEELSLVCDVLGRRQPHRTHWLFAVVAADPCALIARLRSSGFDATQGASTIGPLSPSHQMREFEPHVLRSTMSRAVFIPAYPEMPARDAARLVHSIFLHCMTRPETEDRKAA